MSNEKQVYGEFNGDGSVGSEPTHFIDTGKPYVRGLPSVRERVVNTSRFYRITPGQDVTDEQRMIWQEAGQPKPAPKGSKPQTSSDSEVKE